MFLHNRPELRFGVTGVFHLRHSDDPVCGGFGVLANKVLAEGGAEEGEVFLDCPRLALCLLRLPLFDRVIGQGGRRFGVTRLRQIGQSSQNVVSETVRVAAAPAFCDDLDGDIDRLG